MKIIFCCCLGWYKADLTMKRYLKKMFPKKINNSEEKDEEIDMMKITKGVGSRSGGSRSSGSAGSSHKRSGARSSVVSSNSDAKYWWDHFEEFQNYDQNKDGPVTFIIEKTLDNPTFFQIRFKDRNENSTKKPEFQSKMNITLIIKIDNRRKHNSHEWFMGRSGFADVANRYE